MTLDPKISEILALAITMELDGIKYYRSAAEKVTSPMGKLMFASLVNDEERHLGVVRQIAQEMFKISLDEVFSGGPMSRVRSIFEENRARLEERVKAQPGDVEIIGLALEMEDKSYRLYADARDRSPEPERKALFDRLTLEEREHYLLLEQTQRYLADTGNWFIYEEHGLMDGG